MAYINDIQRIDNLTIADIIRVSYQYVPTKNTTTSKDGRHYAVRQSTAVSVKIVRTRPDSNCFRNNQSRRLTRTQSTSIYEGTSSSEISFLPAGPTLRIR